MNWQIYLTTIGAILAGAGFLHQLLIKKKEATLETLTEKNKWLEKQLEIAENNSSDVLTERLSNRILVFETELKRLSKDYEANEGLIKEKEAEIQRMRDLMAEVAVEIGRQAGEFADFKSNYMCSTCDARLTTLKDVEEDDYEGTLKEYACGFSEIDGDTVTLCPCDSHYPTFEQLKVETKQNTFRNEWIAYYSPLASRIHRVRQFLVSGPTKEEAEANLRRSYERDREHCKSVPKEPPIEF